MTRQIPQRDVDALKTASHQLVDAAGGVAKAAQFTSTTHSRLSEAASPWHLNRFLSAIHVADLECVAGQPLVTRALAAMAGFDLVPKAGSRPQDFHHHLAHIIMETGDVESHLATSLRDGSISKAEAQQGAIEVQQAIDRLQALLSDFSRLASGTALPHLTAVK
jgi:hypothetical protein